MDSGNSGSLQSSSGGGDDEFDSRCGGGDSSPLSALLRQPSSAPGFGVGSFYGLHQELATPAPQLSQCWSSTPHQGAGAGGGASTAPPASHSDHTAAPAAQQQPPRGSRKRTRASRRAPTTVLTTDTSNFRAMVQEFTGIPAPPFAAASSARSSRFDHLFPSRFAAAAGAGFSPYLLRPFAHKLHAAPSSSYHQPAFIAAAPSTSSPAPANIAVVTSSTAAPNQLAAAPSSRVLGMQDHGGGGGGNYLSFQQSPIGAQLDGNDSSWYSAHAIFVDASGPRPAQRLAGFLGNAHGDELSGLVGAASVSSAGGGCKAMYSSGAPLPTPNAETTAAGMAATTTTTATAAVRTQGVESWICTSD